MGSVSEFLTSSPLSERIRMAGDVVVYRESMSGKRIADALKSGSLVETDEGESTTVLEIGGEILASGKIVQKKGRWYFQVQRMAEPISKEDE